MPDNHEDRELEELRERVQQLETDARRWRYARSTHGQRIVQFWSRQWGQWMPLVGDVADNLVDQAIAAQEKSGGDKRQA